LAASSFPVAGPEGIGPAGNPSARQRAEIPAVERVGGSAVHQEDLPVRDHPAALPSGQRAAAPIACERGSDRDAVDADSVVDAADGLPRKREDVLQERHPLREVASIGEEARERFGRCEDDQLADMPPGRKA
jgi:hypothetical protein